MRSVAAPAPEPRDLFFGMTASGNDQGPDRSHYPYARKLRLGWRRDVKGQWTSDAEDPEQWEVLCRAVRRHRRAGDGGNPRRANLPRPLHHQAQGAARGGQALQGVGDAESLGRGFDLPREVVGTHPPPYATVVVVGTGWCVLRRPSIHPMTAFS